MRGGKRNTWGPVGTSGFPEAYTDSEDDIHGRINSQPNMEEAILDVGRFRSPILGTQLHTLFKKQSSPENMIPSQEIKLRLNEHHRNNQKLIYFRFSEEITLRNTGVRRFPGSSLLFSLAIKAAAVLTATFLSARVPLVLLLIARLLHPRLHSSLSDQLWTHCLDSHTSP